MRLCIICDQTFVFSMMFVVVARKIFQNTSGFALLLAGLLFATHPIHTESIASVVGRAEPLSAIFMLGAFLAYAQATR